MKLSSDLLRQIAIGVTGSLALAACSLVEDIAHPDDCDSDDCTVENCDGDCQDPAEPFSCPACGMG